MTATRLHESPWIGRVLEGRWQITSLLGEGAMGTVYRADQRSVDRVVAVKTLRPELADSPEFVQRFLRETRLASSLSNPHCVTVHDFGQTDDGLLYFVMEYLEGQTLAARLDAGPMSVKDILEVCMQATSGLSAAHQQRIVHRDLKPENIFMLSMPDHSVFIKVMDFGIAKSQEGSSHMTRAGEVHGTPLFMSPEQCRGLALDGRSDLYSLGCILYYMLTGHLLFYSDNPMTVMLSHIGDPVPPVAQVTNRRDIPPRLAQLCMQLLEKDPNYRPTDAPSVREALRTIYEQLTATHSSTPAHGDARVSARTSPGAAIRSTDTWASAQAPAVSSTSQSPQSAHPLGTPPTLDELTSQLGAAASLRTPASAWADPQVEMQSSRPNPTPDPGQKWWMLALVLIGLIFVTGTLAAVGTWLVEGGPDYLAQDIASKSSSAPHDRAR